MKTVIRNASIVSDGNIIVADMLIAGERIEKIGTSINLTGDSLVKEINAEGLYLLPRVIDDQVHFREPGLTHKGNIYSESRAAVAGGITSFMEMPNTMPNTLTQALLEEKYSIASKTLLKDKNGLLKALLENRLDIIATDHAPHTFEEKNGS